MLLWIINLSGFMRKKMYNSDGLNTYFIKIHLSDENKKKIWYPGYHQEESQLKQAKSFPIEKLAST